ncbi:HK97 family phage prohead protease [Sphingopyxis sp. LK2115]|uniref:HK97 family phage prohead protease n=1 Tax=Sphingopyxis sp. LK2115 TaxID=2744558 RepID=UPI0016614E5B|nr:HK97 family phage prohead protease [Sphingopyxis sp. LK2115]
MPTFSFAAASAPRREQSAVRFAGYAAVFDRVDRGGDVVRAGAFAASLREGRAVPLLWQHRPGAVVGVVEALAEDRRGLRVVARLTHPTAAALVARGALTGLSFGYRVRAARGARPRELLALDLAEVSLVAVPMQPLARVIAVSPPFAGMTGKKDCDGFL